MAYAEPKYGEAEKFIRANAINRRSLNSRHLAHLINELHIPPAKLAELLKLPPLLIRRQLLDMGWTYEDPPSRRIWTYPKPQKNLKTPRLHVTVKYQDAYDKGCAYVLSRYGEARTRPTLEDLQYLYGELKLSLNHVASLFNRTQTAVRNWLKDAGIKSRSIAETKTTHYNATFFKEWSPAMAWVLGLIYTDGNLSRGRVSFSSMDRELLEKVRALIAPLHSISRHRTSYDRRKRIGRFDINAEDMVNDLR